MIIIQYNFFPSQTTKGTNHKKKLKLCIDRMQKYKLSWDAVTNNRRFAAAWVAEVRK